MKRTLLIVSLIVLLLAPMTACSRIQNQERSAPGSQATPTLAPGSSSQDTINSLVNDLDNSLNQLDSQLKTTDTIPDRIP